MRGVLERTQSELNSVGASFMLTVSEVRNTVEEPKLLIRKQKQHIVTIIALSLNEIFLSNNDSRELLGEAPLRYDIQ